MSRDLAPRDPRSPAKRAGGEVGVSHGQPGELSTRSSGQLRYSPAEVIGFAHVPDEIARQLRRENIITGPEVAAWAEPPVTRRRAGGSVYQVVSAWWADSTRLAVFDIVRDLEEAGKGKFRPAGAWVPRGTLYQFPANVSAVTYSSAPEEGDGKNSGASTTAVAEDPLDVLPEYLRSPLRGGTAGACLETRRGWARETVVAHSADAGRVRVLRAQREARSERSLSQGTWTITSLDTPVSGSRRIGAAPVSPAIAVRGQQAPPIEAPRTYW
jgi:hypothetical protein